MKLKSLHDLLIYGLRGLWDSQNQLVDFWPEMADAASDEQLRQNFQRHGEATEDQVDRLRRISDQLQISLEGVSCEVTASMIKDARKIIDAGGEDSVRDAGLICEAQFIEHFEMAAFGCVKAFARQLGMTDVADELDACSREAGDVDKKLTQLAERSVNVEASRK